MKPDPNIFATLGCRLNACETDAMRDLAAAAGLEHTVVVNTCAVTAEAVRKSRQTIRRLRRTHPAARIIATGCAAQVERAKFSAMPEIDGLIENVRKLNADDWARLAGSNDQYRLRRSELPLPAIAPGRTRAYVQVQNGCDHRCTFCIIPFGRGGSRSIAAEDVVERVKSLVSKGFKEVVLTGVDITDWGADLDGRPTLGRLLAKILENVQQLPRLRVSSVDPVEIDDEFLDLFGAEERLMPHLHLSLQSGDDMILKRMKRRHLRADVIGLCQNLRSLRPDMVFGADMIAGFPTETDSMFDNSLRIVEECDLTWLHVFPFSAREGTPAARMPQLEKHVVRERAARLRVEAARKAESFRIQQIGRTCKVLIETPRTGRTDHFAEVSFGEDQKVGSLLSARMTGIDGDRLTACAEDPTEEPAEQL